MKRLILLRHAKASRGDREKDDHERPLAAGGIWAAEAVARHCAKRLRRVEIALCSSAIRTRETLRLFERHIPPSSKILLDEDLYLAESEMLCRSLLAVEDRFDVVLLVGHEPGLSDLAVTLCGETGSTKAKRLLAKGLKTSSLATIDLKIDSWTQLRPNTGKLREVVRPKDLR